MNDKRQAEEPTGKQVGRFQKGNDHRVSVCSLTRPGFHLRYGHPCPFCGSDQVDYDGLLNLTCGKCGKVQTGVFT